MKKRITALAISAAMIASSVGAFAATGFSDLNEFHAWAEPQIEEMTTMGIIKGYTDGTFRPDRAITKTEALVLVARVAGYITEGYDTFKNVAAQRYADVVSVYSTPYPNEISFLLYKGVLTEDDLAGYLSPDRADSPLLRYEMAVLLTKLMRAEDSLNKSGQITLSYADAGEIPYTAAPYVEYVTNTALMQGVYDPEKPEAISFNPYGSVTRAQMAVLLHRALDKFEISVSYYSVLGKNVANNTITYRDENGKTILYSIKDGVNFSVDGYKTKSVSPVAAGASMAFFYVNGALADVEVANVEASRWNGVESSTVFNPTEPIEGIITTIVLGEECSVVIDDVEYVLSAASTIYVNHVAGTVYDLRVGHSAKLEFAAGKVIMIYATSPSDASTQIVTTEGYITKVNVTNRQIYLEIENTTTGVTSERMLIIETGAAIFNGISGQSIDFLSLEIDDHIIATGTIKDGNFYASKIIVR
ncbi:MAG: S-layer homology domain-containing protein [Clostridia bacterium]|nr:S-layer homology domain-containing protein [Clostridia bacterium]